MSVEKITKVLFQCICEMPNCGNKFERPKIPLRCPKCKSRRWNRPVRYGQKFITYKGETHSLSEWSRILGLSKTTIPWRISKGWSIDQVMSNEDWRRQS